MPSSVSVRKTTPPSPIAAIADGVVRPTTAVSTIPVSPLPACTNASGSASARISTTVERRPAVMHVVVVRAPWAVNGILTIHGAQIGTASAQPASGVGRMTGATTCLSAVRSPW